MPELNWPFCLPDVLGHLPDCDPRYVVVPSTKRLDPAMIRLNRKLTCKKSVKGNSPPPVYLLTILWEDGTVNFRIKYKFA